MNGVINLRKFRNRMIQILLAILLSFTMVVATGGYHSVLAEAAAVAPTVTAKKKTLYVGYDTYKVEIKNLASKATVTYKSSNTKVATVNKSGVVKPIAAGTATITTTVKQNGKTYSLKTAITVEKPRIELTSSIDYLNVDESFLFKAKGYGIDDKIKWSVSDDTIATINSGGKVTALAAGKVTVTAAAGGVKESHEIYIGTNRLGVFSRDISIYEKITLYIHIYEPIEKEALLAETLSKSSNMIDFKWEKQTNNVFPITINPRKVGEETLIISSDKTTDRLYIHITVTDKPKDKKELSAKDLYAKCSPATVIITASDVYGSTSTGSGFFIDNGLIVTNYHVIDKASKISVTTQDNKSYEVKEIAGFDSTVDLALLKVDAENPSLVISQDGVATGESIYALGSPLGLTGTLSDGMISTSSRVIEGVDYIQITAPISPGNSGGPLLNVYGEVIGVNTMYMVNGQNLNFAVNIKELQKVSTSRPISVKDFAGQFGSTNIIYEDPLVSDDPKTCQEISFNSGVAGYVTKDEWWDCYRFKLDKAAYVRGLMLFMNQSDMRITRFQIYTYDSQNPIAYGRDIIYEGKPLQLLTSEYLAPGEYYIAVWVPDGYTGRDIPYVFTLDYVTSK